MPTLNRAHLGHIRPGNAMMRTFIGSICALRSQLATRGLKLLVRLSGLGVACRLNNAITS